MLTRSIIFERVWGYDFGPTSNSLDVYIGYLRRKTEEGRSPRLIHTVRGIGYALREGERMTFRLRIAISAAAAVALTVVLASVLVYVVARGQLRAPVDAALEARAAEISGQPLGVIQSHDGDAYLAVRPEFGEARGYLQLVRSDGSVLVPPRQDVRLPVGDEVKAVASKGGDSFWEDVDVDGTHTRVLTFAYGPGAAVQVARP